jgi:hypothetical protein
MPQSLAPSQQVDGEPKMTPMTTDEALAKAAARAGSDDFGPDAFRDGLARNLDALARAPLNQAASEAAHAKIVEDLANRCRIEQWYKAHPEIESQTIEGPVLVCGLPRTGTTATVGMMALDPRFRFPRAWETHSPVPPPVVGEEANDPRAVAAREAAKSYAMASLHLFDPDGPDEDLVGLAALNMRSFHGALPVPDDYLDWWISDDFKSTYAYHARTLKLLQSRRPPNLWLLKAPIHVFKLQSFAAQYPNAKFVMTHRHPLKLIPSVANIMHVLQVERSVPGSLDKHKRGAASLAFWAEGIKRGMAAREAIGEHRFIDIHNNDVVKKPIETFERLYDFLGFDIGPELRRDLLDYNQKNAPGAHGAHDYTLEEYGLTESKVNTAFRDYIERFSL